MRAASWTPAAVDSHDDEVVGAVVQFDDLVGHSTECAIHGARVEDYGLAVWHGEQNAR